MTAEAMNAKKKTISTCRKDSRHLYGNVSALIFTSFSSNSSLVGFLAHTRFLKFISTQQVSYTIEKKTYAGS